MTNPQESAAILVYRRKKGLKGELLPEHCRPQDLASALAVQSAVSEQWNNDMDDSIGAWKCGMPGPDKQVVAPIYTRTIDSIPPVSLWPKGNTARVEPELAFFIGKDLPARPTPYSEEEVTAALSRVHLALELINSRYSDCETPSFYDSLADGLVNQGLFIGPCVATDAAIGAAEIAIDVTYPDTHLSLAGKHPAGNPVAPLFWLVEFLRQRGDGLVAGQAVITGSYAGVVEVPLNTDINITYANLGDMQVSFKAKS